MYIIIYHELPPDRRGKPMADSWIVHHINPMTMSKKQPFKSRNLIDQGRDWAKWGGPNEQPQVMCDPYLKLRLLYQSFVGLQVLKNIFSIMIEYKNTYYLNVKGS